MRGTKTISFALGVAFSCLPGAVFAADRHSFAQGAAVYRGVLLVVADGDLRRLEGDRLVPLELDLAKDYGAIRGLGVRHNELWVASDRALLRIHPNVCGYSVEAVVREAIRAVAVGPHRVVAATKRGLLRIDAVGDRWRPSTIRAGNFVGVRFQAGNLIALERGGSIRWLREPKPPALGPDV